MELIEQFDRGDPESIRDIHTLAVYRHGNHRYRVMRVGVARRVTNGKALDWAYTYTVSVWMIGTGWAEVVRLFHHEATDSADAAATAHRLLTGDPA